MGGAINNKADQKKYIHARIQMLNEVLDAIEPEEAGVEEIDRIISMLDDLELKCKQFRIDWEM